ncbi:RNA polymerase sigma factor [Microbacterium sp. RU33B]|uniref:RNA polymerase sigma factor n=1 Tax=Microbacterium sp. RU33B TaxID=1907390 RepID=UPI000976029A|nr:sigma-70 family RNA polymerase sigma factor [Microbacterium sp. RU33B]
MAQDKRKASHFDEVIRANEADLWRYFQRRLTNPADAAEAYGELLLTAWKLHRKVPTDPTRARMWLFVTARHVMLSSRRTMSRRSAAVQRLVDDMTTNPPQVDGPYVRELKDAMSALSDQDAELIRLIYWDRLPSHEAAAVLGINASTARSRLSKARQALRFELEARPPE